MKSIVFTAIVVCSLSLSKFSYSRDVDRGEIKFGAVYGQAESRLTGRLDNGEYVPDFKRLGLDLSFSYLKFRDWTAGLVELYFNCLSKNFNEEDEVDESFFQFGYRWGIGVSIKKLDSRYNEIYLVPSFSLLSMGIDTALGPSWNPQLGVNLKVGIFYARFFYYGIISHEKHGSGIMISVGILYPSEDL